MEMPFAGMQIMKLSTLVNISSSP